MTSPVSWSLCLALVSLATVYAVFTGGADDPGTFAATVFSLGLAGVAGSLLLFHAGPASRPERAINTAALAFLAYVAFQLVPLPLALLHVISPTRAEIADSLSGITGAVRFAPLSVAPPTTWIQLSRITSYAVAFFVVRQLVRRSPFGPWTAALPLVFIGASQAIWALATSGGATELLSGSYPNRNHFAGLLELTLPFALMYGLSVLHRSGRRGVLAMTHVAQASVPLLLFCVMLAALLFSSSKSGVVASLFSLFFIAAISLGRGLPPGRRWGVVSALAVVAVVAFVFLTPSDLVTRFGAVASDQPSEGRVPIWRDTLRLIAAYPLLGCGLGAFFPAFLRYQIAGVGWAWTNTHNDYLQLLSELGIVGVIAPAVLMFLVFRRAVTAASDHEPSQSRFIGLACAASLVAILIHSLTDFNTYVTANGLVLAWVSGIAATLAAPATTVAPVAEVRPGAVGRGLGPVVLGLGLLTTAYGAAWTQYLQWHQGDIAVERRYCRIGVCDTDGVLRTLREQARAARPDTPPLLSAEQLLAYVDRDAAAPYRWDEIADALNRAGRRADARLAFDRAVVLGPTSASTLLMAAEFQFDDGRAQDGLGLTARSVQVGDIQLYDAAFRMLSAKGVPPAHVPKALSMDRVTTLAFLRRALSEETLDLDAARAAWRWALDRGYADGPLARTYTDALLQHHLDEAAWSDWVRYAARGNAEGYPESNRVFNGGLERDPIGGAFDWRLDTRAGVTASLDRERHRDGTRALRLTFDGTQNVAETGVMQRVYLAPGAYTFRAQVRSQDLSTDQGVAFRISCEANSSRMDATTEAVRGTTDWTAIELPFEQPAECGVVSVRLVRQASLKFDKLVKGSAWVDAVAIEPAAR